MTGKRLLFSLAALIAAYIDPAATLVGVLAGLLLGLHIGGRHMARVSGVHMIRGGARRVVRGRL